jgi:hypothetical protein
MNRYYQYEDYIAGVRATYVSMSNVATITDTDTMQSYRMAMKPRSCIEAAEYVRNVANQLAEAKETRK